MTTPTRLALRRRWYDEGFYGPESMAEHLMLGAERHPSVAMHFVGGPRPASIELAEMLERSKRLAGGLAAAGVGEGEVVAIWVPNWLEGALTYQAAWMIGATIVPIIHIYGPREVGFILNQSGARTLVMPDVWRGISYRERYEAIDVATSVERVVVIGDLDAAPAGATAWDALAAHDPLAEAPRVDPDDVCLIIYTSGTTADPKGVKHTTNTLVAEIRSTAAAFGERGGVHLAAFPAGHIAGVIVLLRMVLLGTSTVVMDQWNPRTAAQLVEEHRVTATSGAPFFLNSMLDAAAADGRDVSSIRNYMVGGGSVPTALVERADAAGIPAFRAYGSSEHPVITTGTAAHPLDKRAGTDGAPTPGNEIRILDEHDGDVAIGDDGEIVSRGPELFVGYTNPELDAESFLPGGWFRTGDIGRLDADGHLTITDRKKDIIIRGGENISSKEVEDLLANHPAVVEAAAVGMPDARYGERVAVFVQLRDGTSLDLDEVRSHFAAAGVARQKTPEHLVVVTEFPRGLSGKVRKFELRARLGTS